MFITQRCFFFIWLTGLHSWMTIGFTIKLKIFHRWSSLPTDSPISSSKRMTRLRRCHCWRSWRKAMNSFRKYPLSVDYKSTTNNFQGSAYERKKHCPFINGKCSCNFKHWLNYPTIFVCSIKFIIYILHISSTAVGFECNVRDNNLGSKVLLYMEYGRFNQYIGG